MIIKNKFITKVLKAVMIITTSIIVISGCGSNNSNDLNNGVVVPLTAEQKEELLFIYQEEKVARDVYITLGQIYTSESTFTNIQVSEQSHIDAVEELCVKYGVDISNVNEEVIGEFVLPELQLMYDTLVLTGQVSLISALEVGILIEETDIQDLEGAVVGMPEDIATVFNNLRDGSINHLAAFNRALLSQ